MNLSLAHVARALSETVNGEKMPRDHGLRAPGLDASLTDASPWVYRSTLFQPVQPAWEGGACLLREAHSRRGAGGAACVLIDPPGYGRCVDNGFGTNQQQTSFDKAVTPSKPT